MEFFLNNYIKKLLKNLDFILFLSQNMVDESFSFIPFLSNFFGEHPVRAGSTYWLFIFYSLNLKNESKKKLLQFIINILSIKNIITLLILNYYFPFSS